MIWCIGFINPKTKETFNLIVSISKASKHKSPNRQDKTRKSKKHTSTRGNTLRVGGY